MNPFRYHTYNEEIVESTEINETQSAVDVLLTTNAQVVEFMNMVFLVHNPINEEIQLTNDGNRLSIRSLYVLKNGYIENAVKTITDCLPRYQTYIQSLRDEGYTIVGYARKLPTDDGYEKRVSLLQAMCENLKERSLVDFTFVSFCSKANDRFSARDNKQDAEELSKINCTGNTQDMLKFIVGKSNICIVALDHAGITTYADDFCQFLW
ncbi:hypothetical protein G6F43_012577 [Rhizopus delemar]|nr:hypothetical protein G6F43_012577 [Rhizopus delemar]